MSHHIYEVAIGVRQEFRVVYRNVIIESHRSMSTKEIHHAALSKVHVSTRYLARITDVAICPPKSLSSG